MLLLRAMIFWGLLQCGQAVIASEIVHKYKDGMAYKRAQVCRTNYFLFFYASSRVSERPSGLVLPIQESSKHNIVTSR
jgi:hypothetical protein